MRRTVRKSETDFFECVANTTSPVRNMFQLQNAIVTETASALTVLGPSNREEADFKVVSTNTNELEIHHFQAINEDELIALPMFLVVMKEILFCSDAVNTQGGGLTVGLAKAQVLRAVVVMLFVS